MKNGEPIAASYVHCIGTAVPEQWLDADQSAELLKQACINPRSTKLLQRIVKLTGIERRYLAALDFQTGQDGGAFYQPQSLQPCGPGMGQRTTLFQKAAGPLVLRAMRSFAPEVLQRVDTLVTVSCTHASSPGLELPVLSQTPVPASADRWNLGFMGCSAGLAAVRLVQQRAALKPTALVIACELSSLHFQYTDELDQMTANLLFADGAAAVLLSTEPSLVRVVGCRGVTLPAAADQMVWFAGDHGLQLRLSQELPETLAAHLPTSVDEFLRQFGLSRNEVRHWLVHPGGPQILDSVEESLRLPANALQRSRAVYRRYGNMSSPTIFFILRDLMASGECGRAVAMAFGPGLTIELVLFEVLRKD